MWGGGLMYVIYFLPDLDSGHLTLEHRGASLLHYARYGKKLVCHRTSTLFGSVSLRPLGKEVGLLSKISNASRSVLARQT